MILLYYGIIFQCLFSMEVLSDEVWEQDLSDMTIGPTTEGYQRVDLACSAEHMEVTIVTDEDFSGVIYTRGNFSDKKFPCFRDLKSGTYFRMNIPFEECNTKNDGGRYTNVLIVQHDDELILPGDAAFQLECDFRKPKDIQVHSSVSTEVFDILSRITLADADPAGKETPTDQRLVAFNESSKVSFVPKVLLRNRDEL